MHESRKGRQVSNCRLFLDDGTPFGVSSLLERRACASADSVSSARMAKMEQPKAKRARKPNYTHEEISVLLEEVATNKVVIQSALTGEVTSQLKGQQWQDIAGKVSNCGVCLRTADQVQEKFSDIKKEFFIREKRRRGTGGGPPVQEKPFDELLTFIIGKESALFSGLCGGPETYTFRPKTSLSATCTSTTIPMAAKMCRTPLHQIQVGPAGDTSLVETSMPAPIHSTPKRMVHGSHSDGTFVSISSLDQQALQGFPSNNVQVVHVDVHHPAEPFLQVQLQDAAADPELEPVQLLQDITAIQDMAGPALEAQSTLSKSRKPDKQKKKKNHSHCGDKRQRNSSENSELFDEYLRSEITKKLQ